MKESCERGILVIGDLMLDTYYYGSVDRVSPEAPVPVVLKKKEKNVLGGAANVAMNIKAAGMEVFLAGVVGNDSAGKELLKKIETCSIRAEYILCSKDRKTTQKTRVMSDSGQQLLRIDQEAGTNIAEKEEKELLKFIKKAISLADVVVLSDYLKGIFTDSLTQQVIRLCSDNGIPVMVDVKDENYFKYTGSFLLKPNLIELKKMTHMPADTEEEVLAAADFLRLQAKCKYVLVTLGSRGMVLCGDKNEVFPSFPVEVYDVTGAGDTAIAYLSSEYAKGKEIHECVRTANLAASIQVSKSGTSAVYEDEVERAYQKLRFQNLNGKILTQNDLRQLRKKKRGRKITFTNGCFDLLHVGHIRYLQKASQLGDILVVGLNSDSSVKRLKGDLRPINYIDDRMEMLAAYPFVDYIIVFDEDTPLELIKLLEPDYLVKGADYKRKENVVGWDVVEGYGGKVVLIDYMQGKSTTSIINRIEYGREVSE